MKPPCWHGSVYVDLKSHSHGDYAKRLEREHFTSVRRGLRLSKSEHKTNRLPASGLWISIVLCELVSDFGRLFCTIAEVQLCDANAKVTAPIAATHARPAGREHSRPLINFNDQHLIRSDSPFQADNAVEVRTLGQLNTAKHFVSMSERPEKSHQSTLAQTGRDRQSQ